MAVLRLEGVTKRFGRSAAVREVSLSVNEGEVVSLLGPSGCGKTTLLRMIAGLETPDTGSITLDEGDITHVPPNRRPVHTIFQNYALFPHLNVRDNVAFGPKVARWERARIDAEVERLLALVRLSELADRKPATLSGGQKQRVAIARALIMQPRLLLLDEPFAALDRALRRDLLDELARLQRTLNLTCVFVTHDQGEAMYLAHRVAVMNDGRILQMDEPAAVYDRPSDPFTARFFGDAHLIEGTIAHQDRDRLELHVPGFGTVTRNRGEGLPSFETGDAAWLCLRTEHLNFSAEPPADPALNAVEASVRTAVFQGGVWRCEVIAHGHLFSVSQLRHANAPAPAPGDAGWLWWPANTGWLDRADVSSAGGSEPGS